MPLSKLFHKRNSLKDKKAPLNTNQDTGSQAVVATPECTLSDNVNETAKSEVSSPTEQLQSDSEISPNTEENGDGNGPESKDVNTQLELPTQNLIVRELSVLTDDNQMNSLEDKTDIPNVTRSKTRSFSCKDTVLESHSPKSGRRKCDSESAAYNSTDDEGFEEKMIQFREKDLEKVIGQCVNRLIQESIATAVRSVNVDSLCEEVRKTISDRNHSESSESSECPDTIEHKLHTNSVSEYVDLETLETFEPEEGSLLPKDVTFETEEGSLHPKDDTFQTEENALNPKDGTFEKDNDFTQGKDSKEGSVGEVEELNNASLDGYHADCEESISLNSLASENSHEDVREPENTPESSNCDKIASEDITDGCPKFNQGATLVQDQSVDSTLKPTTEEMVETDEKASKAESEDLITMSDDDVSQLLAASTDATHDESVKTASDLGENLLQQAQPAEDEKKVNWKVGYLHVKLPHKSRSKGHLKVWKKRCVAIQQDEFANDPKDPCLMISVYSAESGTARKHSATFWKSVSCQKAVVYRSNSSTHRYAFTVSDDNKAVVHLAAESEASSQEWMAAIRSILWPPSPVMQLEKMLNGGSQFEISLIDNEFSYHAGLLGMYGYLTITPKKLILVHPQEGYIIQEWYLNTVDKFELMQQTRIEDVHKVLAMTTCSDSSTGKGAILIYCREALSLLQTLASTIHQILTYHSKQEGGKYQKELIEMAEWLVPSSNANNAEVEEYYKVPPRQVKSLLDIPNFIFDKPLTPVASVTCSAGMSMDAMKPTLEASKSNPTRASQDSGISAGTVADDFLNCSITSFMVGGGAFPGKSSDSELSDSYTPPLSPAVKVKHVPHKTGAVASSKIA